MAGEDKYANRDAYVDGDKKPTAAYIGQELLATNGNAWEWSGTKWYATKLAGKTITDSLMQKSAFDEISVVEPNPVSQETFPYNVNPDIWNIHENNGTASVVDHQLNLSTGAGANQSAEILTKVPVKYNAGQGGLVRFSGLFTLGVADSTQLIGIGDSGDGYFFGYNGADFGVLRRIGGHQEIRELTITTGSADAENITITLDGDADATVAVTASSDTDVTANEIAAHDFSNLGRGWAAHSDGDGVVTFTSYNSTPRTGTYSLSGATSAVGTFAQLIAGVVPTDTWVAQTAWNGDRFLFTTDPDHSPSGATIDHTKGNIFQITYQWLGYGPIEFSIEDPATDDWVVVHTIKHTNQNILPSVNNPTLPLYYIVENVANTSDLVENSGSIGGFVHGKTNGGHLHHGVDATVTGITAEVPLLTLHNPLTFVGVPNRVRMKLISVGASADGTKPAVFRIKRDATLTTADYNSVEANVSVGEFDIAATTIANGDKQFTVGVGRTGSDILDLSTSDYFLNPGERLTITGQSANSTDVIVSYNWEERF